jgi:hypothetical protein
MRIDPRQLSEHYAAMSDEQLLDIQPDDLSEIARPIYEAEVANRRLHETDELELSEEITGADYQPETRPGHAPDWLEYAACACVFGARSADADEPAANAREALQSAGIPCHITVLREDPVRPGAPPHYEFRAMVPTPLLWHATSVLDRDLFNHEQEDEFRAHLEGLTDEEFQAVDPNLICAGLLDRAARLKKAYAAELAQRRK